MPRYDQCDHTCTVDCGHCKGQGPPRDLEVARTVVSAPDSAALLAEVAGALEQVGCQFFACDGPTLEPVDMVTCFVCDLLARVRVAIGQPPTQDSR